MYGGAGLVIEIILAAFTNETELKIRGEILNLVLGKSMWNYPLWFLVAFFVSIYIIDKTEKVFSKVQYKVLVISCCFILGNILGSIGKYHEIYFPFRLDIGLVMVIFIFLAYYTRKYIIYLETLNFYYKLIVVIVSFIINFVAYKNNQLISVSSSEYGNPIAFLVSSIFGSLFIVSLCLICEKNFLCRKIFSWYGKNSLIIMCSHVILLKIIVKGLQLAGFYVESDLKCEWFIFILIMVGIVPFCYIVNFMEGNMDGKKNISYKR